MQTALPKRTQNIFIFLGIIVLFSTVSLAATNTAFLVTSEIYQGTTVGDIPVGGLTAKQAEAKISAAFASLTDQQPVVTLEYQSESWVIKAQDIDLNVDAKTLSEQAYAVGRTGNVFSQLKDRYLAMNRGVTIPFDVTYNQDKLKRLVGDIAKSVDRDPQNAAIQYDGSNIQVIPETVGRKVDIVQELTDIAEQIRQQLTVKLKLSVSEMYPVIRTSDLAQINGLLASYSTQFDSNDANRSQNIFLAAKSINGTLVKAGQEFSFNTNVGPRLANNGYKEAPVFVEGKLVPDFGGGVCQVSSTLYNAVLLADMDILERTPHFRPPGYVPLGQDATVADNLLDFRFKNTMSENIYIASSINGNQLTIFVYGRRDEPMPELRIVTGENKVLEPNTIVKQDPSLDLGKQVVEADGQKGFYVTTYRVKMMGNKEVKREFLASDEFKPVDRVIRIGTKIANPTK